jgi:hypothetical protein
MMRRSSVSKLVAIAAVLLAHSWTACAADDLTWGCPKPGTVFNTSIGKWAAFGTGDPATFGCHYMRDGVDVPRYAGIYIRARITPEAKDFWPLKNGTFVSWLSQARNGIGAYNETVRTSLETVTVPAGTFETMQIIYRNAYANVGIHIAGIDVTETFYWSPLLNFPVKHTKKVDGGYPTGLDDDWELLSVETEKRAGP